MGSALGGLKAGVIAGIFFVGLLGLVNLFLLYIFKQDAIKLIEQNYSEQCATITAEGCFLSVVEVYLPVNIFVNYMVLLVFSSIYGRLFEYIPGRSYSAKGFSIALVLLLTLSFLGSVVTQFTFLGRVIVLASALVLTVVFGIMLGRFYRRYTRIVEFQSTHPEELRVIVDGRDVTGKKLTFPVHSIHKAKAEGNVPFRSWAATGGVSVEDQKSFETEFEVSGDGVLRANGRHET